MDQEPDVIRQHIDETRSSLTEKLETLEGQVRGTVQDAKATVEDTIENVKATVQDTVASVKKTFDLRYQTEQHPWAMVGGSVVAGYVLGTLATPPRGYHRSSGGTRQDYSTSSRSQGFSEFRPNGASAASAASATPASSPSAKPSFLGQVLNQFHDEIEQVKGLAVGAAVGLLRDYVKQTLPPSLSAQVDHVMNSATSKLGGHPVSGPVMESSGTGGTRT